MSETLESTENVVPQEVEVSITPEITTSTPIAEPPVVAELPEQIYEYQPTDEQGRPLGGKQVLKFRTQQELINKMQEQNVLLVRRLRAETKKNRLGISEPEEIPAGSQFNESFADFTPQTLTPDETVRISRDLLDPERFVQARDRLFESAIGVNPNKLGETLRTLQTDNLNFKAKIEADAFLVSNPSYVKCKENFEAITNWMARYNLAPVRDNFQEAYNKLKEAGVLIESADVVTQSSPAVLVSEPVAPLETPAVTTTSEPVEETEPAAAVPPVTVVSRVPTALSRSNSSDTGAARPVAEEISYELVTSTGRRVLHGMAALNAMPSDEYKRRLTTERGFAAKVEKIEAAAKRR